MGKRQTVTGFWRQRGATSSSSSKLPPIGPTPAVVPQVIEVDIDSALPNTTLLGKTLPKGARMYSITLNGGAAGGTTPAIDVGLDRPTPDPDALVNGADPTANHNITNGDALAGAAFGAPLASDAQLTGGDDGTGTAATGVVTASILYFMDDDGAIQD